MMIKQKESGYIFLEDCLACLAAIYPNKLWVQKVEYTVILPSAAICLILFVFYHNAFLMV